MSAVHITTTRTLLLSMILMILARETVSTPDTTGMLSFTGDEKAAGRTHKRRHQPGSSERFQSILKGRSIDDGGMMADEDAISKRRSITGGDKPMMYKHITNINHHTTLFYDIQHPGSFPLQAINKEPNNSNSLFKYQPLCMASNMRKVFEKKGDRGCQFQSQLLDERKIFSVEHNDQEYFMCAKEGKKVEMTPLSDIQTIEDAKNCTWRTMDAVSDGNSEFIYTHYKNSCRHKKGSKCRDKRGFLTIHLRKRKSNGDQKLKVILRYYKPPKTLARPKRFWRGKNLNDSKFYIYTSDDEGKPHFENPLHLGTTERPNSHTSIIDTPSSSPKVKKRKNNCKNLLMNNINCGRRRGGRRRNKKKGGNLLDTQKHSTGVTLIRDAHRRRHTSLLDMTTI